MHQPHHPRIDHPLAEKVRSRFEEGETLLWCGVPSPRRFVSEMLAYVLFGLIPFCISSLLLTLMARDIAHGGFRFEMLPGYLVGSMAGFGFLTLGIGCFLYPFMMRSRLREVIYAISDRRALVITSPKLLWNPVPPMNLGETSSEFGPEQLRQYQAKWRDFGRRDLIFAKKWQRGRRGGRWHYFGFLGLDDLHGPEQILVERFLATKPKHEAN